MNADYSLYYVSADVLMRRLGMLMMDRKWMESEQMCTDIIADIERIRADCHDRKVAAIAAPLLAAELDSIDPPIPRALMAGQF